MNKVRENVALTQSEREEIEASARIQQAQRRAKAENSGRCWFCDHPKKLQSGLCPKCGRFGL